MMRKTFSASSGVMEGRVFLPLRVISMNFVFLERLLSRGNQLLRYLPHMPQRWVTPSESIRATLSISLKRMVLDVARGKKYLLMTINSLQTVTCGSLYRISLIYLLQKHFHSFGFHQFIIIRQLTPPRNVRYHHGLSKMIEWTCKWKEYSSAGFIHFLKGSRVARSCLFGWIAIIMLGESRKFYSNSLRRLVNLKLPLSEQQPVSPPIKKRGNASEAFHLKQKELAALRLPYAKQLDSIVKQLAEERHLPVEAPQLRSPNSYRNYRIHTQQAQEKKQKAEADAEDTCGWRQRQLPKIRKQQRVHSQPKEYQLSQQRDNIYGVIRHYRLKSLKQMELQVDVRQLEQWHNHHKQLALQREMVEYRPPP